METTSEIELPRDHTCSARARRWLEESLDGRLTGERLDDARLVLTELVDNAYMHGEGRIRARLHVGDERVRVEVIDEGEDVALTIDRHGTEIGRWGLMLVESVALEWGAFEGTTHVWADLPVDPAA